MVLGWGMWLSKVYYGSWHHCITFRLRVECTCLQCFWQVGKLIFGALLGSYYKWCPILSLHTVGRGGGVLFVCILDVG